MRIDLHVEALVQDICVSFRWLSRERAFTATALLTLALGIGSTTAVFTLVDVLLLRSLPVKSAEGLFTLSAPGKKVDLAPSYYSHGFYEHLRNSNPIFANLFASSTVVSSGVNLFDGAVTDRVRCELVSGNYFDVLGIGAAAGRTLGPGDDRTPGSRPVVVLSFAFWQRRFAGEPDVVGRAVTVNGSAFTVVGVAKRGFFGTKPGFGPDIWVPLMMVSQVTNGSIRPLERNQNYLEMTVRLEPPFETRRVEAMAATIYADWLDERPTSQPRIAMPTVQLTSSSKGHSLLRAEYGQPLLLLTAAVLLLLLIACANISTLMMSRATARAKEIAIRTAIGATRSRLVRQLITEAGCIAAIGGVCGWFVSIYFEQLMLSFLPATAESWQFSPNVRVFAATFVVAGASGLLFGLAPAVQLGRHQAVTLAGRTPPAPRTIGRILDPREVLTVVQIALTILLVTGTGLFAQTLRNLRASDMGFSRDHIVLASIDPAKSGYDRPRTAAFFQELVHRLRVRENIDAVGLASHGTLSGVLPAGTRFMSTQMHGDGGLEPASRDLTVHQNVVSPEYFEASGIALMRGRPFTEFDREGNAVAIVNMAAAQLLFGNDDPLGRRLGSGRQGPTPLEVVGLVENAKYLSVREAPIPTVYLPFRDGSPMTLHVKTRADAQSALRVIEQEVKALDPTLPLFQVQTIEARVDDALREERLVATLAAILGLAAMLIAAVGICGVISFSVAQRTREIGIRLAVGAEPRQILLMVLARVCLLVTLGSAVGLPMALGSSRVAAAFLFGVSAWNPAIIASVLAVVTVVSLSAGLIPAGKAARTDAWNALRSD